MAQHTRIEGPNPDIVLFCDHASNHVPPELDGLGLPPAELSRHIAWDIGAEAVTRRLAEALGATALVAGVSRLVIDLNRDPASPGLIPEVSDGTVVPANTDMSEAARAERKTRYYDPYHAALGELLDSRPGAFAVSVHSFTPHPREGERRDLDLGLLAKREADGGDWASAQGFLGALPEGWTTAINAPYSAYDLNHTVDAHVISRGLRHLGIEIRQDHIGTDEQARAFADRILPAIAQQI